MKEVTIYTDGACSGNPGPGGWAAILQYKGMEKELSGGERNTTNNRMELTAVIRGLEALKEPCAVTVYTDSQYISRAIGEGWLAKWKKNGFTKKGGLKNAELWRELDSLLQRHTVTFQWVKGHAENDLNNRCDRLAVREREKFA
ncbi:MAG: ribonuclease HI [Oscillospiraceae bacterium]|nr:ribonuclease HI [Oscillospiraceae bacterium]